MRWMLLPMALAACGLAAGEQQPLKELPSTGWAALHGQVTYEGALPPLSLDLRYIPLADDEDPLQAPQRKDGWRIDPVTKGVANAVISLEPPRGQIFKIHPDDRKPPDVVLTIAQRQFRPRVVVLFGVWRDQPTGQKLKVANNGKGVHDLRAPLPGDAGLTFRLSPGKQIAWPAEGASPLPVVVDCTDDPRMKAHVWLLDHPYAAVTDAQGKFKIPRVPAGVELLVFGKHEEAGFFYGGAKGVPLTFTADKTHELKLTIKAKKG